MVQLSHNFTLPSARLRSQWRFRMSICLFADLVFTINLWKKYIQTYISQICLWSHINGRVFIKMGSAEMLFWWVKAYHPDWVLFIKSDTQSTNSRNLLSTLPFMYFDKHIWNIILIAMQYFEYRHSENRLQSDCKLYQCACFLSVKYCILPEEGVIQVWIYVPEEIVRIMSREASRASISGNARS